MIGFRSPVLAAALFTGVAAVGLTPALAQTNPTPANAGAAPAGTRQHAAQRMLPGQLVDGRIAFLKAELKITPQQEAQCSRSPRRCAITPRRLTRRSRPRGKATVRWMWSSALSCASSSPKCAQTTMCGCSPHSSRFTPVCRRTSSRLPTSWLDRSTTDGTIAPEAHRVAGEPPVNSGGFFPSCGKRRGCVHRLEFRDHRGSVGFRTPIARNLFLIGRTPKRAPAALPSGFRRSSGH